MITIATLATATAQEVFDQVAAHLKAQGKKSVKEGTTNECLYRGPNGLKCAAGILISDEEYKANMEGHTWRTVTGYGWPNGAGAELSPHFNLINSLQVVHYRNDVDYWYLGLRKVAKEYKLVY